MPTPTPEQATLDLTGADRSAGEPDASPEQPPEHQLDLMLALLATDSPLAGEIRRGITDAMGRYADGQFLLDHRSTPDRQDPAMALLKRLLVAVREHSTDFYEKRFCACRCHAQTDQAQDGTTAEPAAGEPEVPDPSEPPDAPAEPHASAVPAARTAPATDAEPVESGGPADPATVSAALRATAVERDTEADHAAPTDTKRLRPTTDVRRTGLVEIIRELQKSEFVDAYLPPLPTNVPSAQLWEHVHLALLRLPTPLRWHWRDRLRALVPERPDRSDVRLMRLPTLQDHADLLLPAWHAEDAYEVWSDPNEEPPEHFGYVLATAYPTHPLWGFAVLVSQACALARLDTRLLDAASDPTNRKFRSLNIKSNVEQYRSHVMRRLRELADANSPDHRVVRAWRLDEALRSAVHMPVSAGDSWWGDLRTASYHRLEAYCAEARRAGHDVTLRHITGRRSEALEARLCEPDLDALAPGRPDQFGTIAACLRLYLEVDSKSYAGRVLYYGG